MARRRWVILAASVTLALGLLTGCGDSSSQGEIHLPTAPGSSRTTGHGHHRGAVGACHLVPDHVFHDLVRTSASVPCTRRHDLETAGVHPVYAKLTKTSLRSIVRGYGDACDQDYLDYLGLQAYEAVRVRVIALAVKQPAGSWAVSCDLYLQTRFAVLLPVATTRTSIRAEARSGETTSWGICTDRPPTTDVPLADCARPHAYEAVRTYQTVTALEDVYPTPAQLVTRGRSVCRRAVAGRADAGRLDVFAHWETRRAWLNAGRPTDVYGTCYFHRRGRG
jgi:hypothetical protein